jgi:hypothetical protein
MLKIPAVYDRDTSLAKFTDLSHQVSSASLLISAGYCQKDESGMIITYMG